MFRGREQAHPERGRALLDRLFGDLGELAIVEQAPQQEGRNMHMILAPGKTAGESQPAGVRAAPGRRRSASIPRSPMPKMKSHSGAKKRFKKTVDAASSAAVARTRATSSRRSRRSGSGRWRSPVAIAPADKKRVKKLLGRQVGMPRATNAVARRKRRKKTLAQAKGYYGRKHSSYRFANEQLMRSGQYAYRDRRNRKREFRRLWITRINAAARQNGMSYSELIHGLSEAGVEVNRKMLADIAVRDPEAFRRFAEVAREAVA